MNISVIIFFSFIGVNICVFDKKQIIDYAIDADRNEFPCMASIKFISPELHFCGGVIISQLHVLTSAQCLIDKISILDKIVIYTGSISPGPNSGNPHVILKVDIHPAFEDNYSSKHDLAIVTLQNAITFNDAQNKMDLTKSNISVNAFGDVPGWGGPNSLAPSATLKKMNLKIMKVNLCNQFFQKPIGQQQFCAYNIFGPNLGFGYNGGPMIINNEVVGIVAATYPYADNFTPSIFINVFDYLDFINNIIEYIHS